MILVDSSIWIDHLRDPNLRLLELLEQDFVLGHPFVLGELAMGSLKDRAKVLQELLALPAAPMAEDLEVLALVDNNNIYGSGIGYIDAHLLASVRAMGAGEATLWTRDRRLQKIAVELALATDMPETHLQ